MNRRNKPNINYTTTHDLCLGCGVCEGSCPTNAIQIEVKQGRFLPKVNDILCNNNQGCHHCFDSCPGLGVDLLRISATLFPDNTTKKDRMAGRYLKCFTGYSNDYNIRFHCASGGMVTQFLIYLLENKYIDGAVVTTFDPLNELLVHSFIARTKEEILKAKSSKYSPVTMDHVIQDIKSSEGKYVIVGLPCHIQGFRKYEALNKSFKKKIVGYFSIYCSSGRSFYLTEYVFKKKEIDKKGLKYFAYRDEGCLGSLIAKGIRTKDLRPFHIKERYQNYYHPLRSFFIPRRCLFCIDHYGELADLCFGDIHIEPYIEDKVGINSIVARSREWMNLLLRAKEKGVITLNEISIETLNQSQKMASKKKGRNARFIALNKRLNRVMPVYDELLPKTIGLKTVVDYIQNRLQQFIGCHKSMWWLVSLLRKDTSRYE